MTKNIIPRTFSVIIATILFFETTVSTNIGLVSAYANTNGNASEQTSEPFLSGSNVTEKGENYTVFEHEDGSETLQIYTGNVRVEDEDGNLTDVDNSIEKVEIDGETSYVNANGFVDVTLPEELASDNPIKVENGADSVKFLPAFGDIETFAESESKTNEDTKDDEQNTAEDNRVETMLPDDEQDADMNNSDNDEDDKDDENNTGDVFVHAEDAIEIEGAEELSAEAVIEEEVTDLYNQTEEKQTGIRYETPDPDVSIEYCPIDMGVKENIILEAEPESNIFSFVIKSKGQYLEKEQRGIVFKDVNTDKVKGAIQEPFMTDSSDSEDMGYSEELEYEINALDEDKGIYKVDLIVSREYLSDKSRVYPVIIDPTYTANVKDKLKDAYVLSKHSGTNYYSNGVTQMVIGYGNDGICRTYIQFPNLQSIINGAYINSASFKVKERNNTKPYATLGIYRVTKSWNLSKITYNNQPTYNGTAVATKALKGGTNVHTVSLTSLVQGWSKGSYANYGILLRATTEKSSTRNFCSLYGSRIGTASYRPVLSVNYVKPSPAKPATPVVKASSSYIKKGNLKCRYHMERT